MRILAFAVLVGGSLVGFAACSTNSLEGQGGACYQTLDCQDGLVCIGEDGGQAGKCTNDISTIVVLPAESGTDAMMPMPDGAMMDSPIVADQVAPKDNNVPDTFTTDTGMPETGGDATGE